MSECVCICITDEYAVNVKLNASYICDLTIRRQQQQHTVTVRGSTFNV